MNQGSRTEMRDTAAMRWTRAGRGAFAVAALMATAFAHAQSQAVSQPFNYTRTSAISYYVQSDGVLEGLVKSETVEPNNAALCVVTSYSYDSYGNRNGSTTAPCTGGSTPSVTSSFVARSSTSNYAAVAQQAIVVSGTSVNVSIPAGMFATTVANTLNQQETHTFDPRFGAALSVTGPNGLTTSYTYDDFGRKTRELRADGTSVVTSYCLLSGNTTSNSSGCASLVYATNEIPANAYMVVHSEPHNAANAVMGAYQRVFTDAEGRTLRASTQSFDGASQPTSVGRVVVQDTVYSSIGAVIMTTQPYFLATGSSTLTGSQDVGVTSTQYDLLGRPTYVVTADPHGSQASVSFGSFGTRTASITGIVYAASTTTVTDDLGRTRTEEKDLAGNVVRITDPTGAQLARQYDAFDNLVQTKDALQNLVTVTYDLRGNKLSLSDPDSGLTMYCYDALGQLKAQQTASMRGNNTAQACPTDIDSTTTAKAETGWTTMAYDTLGRVRQRAEPEDVSSWAYDAYLNGAACAKGVGKLCESSSTVGSGHRYAFDALGRLASSSETTNAAGTTGFASAVTYDASTGRMATKTYPTGLQIAYVYTASSAGSPGGFLNGVQLASQFTVNPLPHAAGAQAGAPATLSSGTMLWQPATVDAWGHATADQLGNGVTDRSTFEASTGRPTTLLAGAGSTGTGVLNLSYVWDSLGRLSTRTDSNGAGDANAVVDGYQYDGVDRLVQYTVQAPGVPNYTRTVTMQYNAIGNLLYKSDVGTYGYAPYGNTSGTTNPLPHAVATLTDNEGVPRHYSYDAGGNLTAVDAGSYRALSYTSFNLPDSSTGMAGPSASPRYTYVYDENHQRIKETRVDSSGTQVTWFANPDNAGGLGFESETSASGVLNNRHYITAGSQTLVLVTTGALPALSVGQTAPTPNMTVVGVKVEYWHKDFLGNLTTTTNHLGVVTAYYSYDPFGKRRNPGGAYDAAGALVIPWSTTLDNGTGRGYTAHEQLDDIGLVHMNGRLFDPTLGRFLQTDPMLQSPDNLQNYNRYSYCLNNPVTCNDPSGYFHFNFNKFYFALAHADPWSYWATKTVAHTDAGYQIGFIAIGFVSGVLDDVETPAVGMAFAAAANAVWVGFHGGTTTDSLRAGAIAGLTAVADSEIGSAFQTCDGCYLSTAENTLAHAALGCGTARLSGDSCSSGAASGFVSAAWSNYCEDCGNDNLIEGTITHATIGGIASVVGGGKFSTGAETGAFAYIFNQCGHANCFGGLAGDVPPNQMSGLSYIQQSLAGAYAKLIAAVWGNYQVYYGAGMEGTHIVGGMAQIGSTLSINQGPQGFYTLGDTYGYNDAAPGPFVGYQNSELTGPGRSINFSYELFSGSVNFDENWNYVGITLAPGAKLGGSVAFTNTCTFVTFNQRRC